MQTSTIRKFHGEPTNREENVTHARRNHSQNGRIRPITVSRRYQDLRGLDRANRERRRVTFHGVNDSGLVLLTFTLCIFGLMMLFSTSSYNAALQYGDSAYFLKHQAGSVVAGLLLMVVLSRFPDYHLLAHFAIPAYLGSLALILMVIPFGYSSHGAKRWIRIAGMSVQPAEVAKVAMILFLAALICKMRQRICKGRGFWFFLATPLLPCALIYKVTQNLSSAAIVFGITIVMLSPHRIMEGFFFLRSSQQVWVLPLSTISRRLQTLLLRSALREFWPGCIRRTMRGKNMDRIRPYKVSMPLVPAGFSGRDRERVCKRPSFPRHKMI